MRQDMPDDTTMRELFAAQRNEITEYQVYRRLSKSMKAGGNSEVLAHIAEDELRHYNIWKTKTGRDVAADTLKAEFYILVSRLFGLTFGVKLMENGEKKAQSKYKSISAVYSEGELVAGDEERHERELIAMIDEDMLKYVSSIVLGLNDALVEFTGALAGFAFALQSARLVAITGIIMGFAASLSMAASEYLSTKSEGDGKNPLKAATYTGIVYLFTVALLVAPFLLTANVYLSLALTMAAAVLSIALFTYYISVAKDLSFKRQFTEMAAISLCVAALTFVIGYVVKNTLGVNV
jgi:vacuolar iron transporter family protein